MSGPAPADGALVAGVDIGGTKIVAGVVDGSGRIVHRVQRETPDRSTAPVVVEEAIADAVSALAVAHDVRAVGVGAAGFVDADGERVRFAPHLSWRDEPLRARLSARLGLPVLVDNDANTALWAELRFGAAAGHRHAVMVTLGTGIGGALVLGGELYRGSNGMAGEFGHTQVVPDGHPCECGRRGCWEQYCSGKALTRFARDAGSSLAGSELTAAAQAGDPVALGAYAEVGRWLGIGVADLVASFDPGIVIVGGGVSAAGDLLLGPARRTLADSLVGGRHRAHPEVAVARLGPLAGLVGAADLARRTHL